MATPDRLFDRVLQQLEGVKGPDATGNYLALCPFHDDRRPSLSLHRDKGWNCFAGCGQGTIADLAERLGVASKQGDRDPEVVYRYTDGDGELLLEVLRYPGKRFVQRRPNGKGGWIWNLKGVPKVLYRLPELLSAPPDVPVFIVEGEKDVEALCSLGLTATCNPGGAGKFTPQLREPLRGRPVVIIADKDVPGRKHAHQVAQMLHGFAATVKVLELPGEKVKDSADWLAGGGTKEGLELLVEQTPEWEPGAGTSLPQIRVSNRHLREISGNTWEVLCAANNPPILFQRGHLLVDIMLDDNGQPVLRPLDKAAFKGILDRLANFVVESENGSRPARPPGDVVADMMAAKEFPLPVLLGIIEAPVFAPPGVLTTASGFQPQTGYYLHMAQGLAIPQVLQQPAVADMYRARHMLLDELLGDFPFVEDADRAHALSALLLPFVRLLIDGPTPLHLVESPTPGSGKGLLVDIIAIAATGKGPNIMTEAGDEEEWRKRITAKLLQAPQFILLDNVRTQLNSAALAAALTSQTWEDRLLGHSQVAAMPVTCIWLATANNPSLSLEIARRTVSIRLDAGLERPWQRNEFRHQNLREWARKHRGDLIWAVLTLIQAWIAAGKPAGDKALGSYESWAEVIGGILRVAGIPGFLGNIERVYSEADLELLPWTEFCSAWYQEYPEEAVTTERLFHLAMRYGLLGDMWAARSEHASRTRFGKALASMRDRIIGGFRVRRTGHDPHSKAAMFRLELLAGMATEYAVAGVAGVAGVVPPSEKSAPPDDIYQAGSYAQANNGNTLGEVFDESKNPRNPRNPRNDPWDGYLEETDGRTS